jgi:hypothetical protein
VQWQLVRNNDTIETTSNNSITINRRHALIAGTLKYNVDAAIFKGKMLQQANKIITKALRINVIGCIEVQGGFIPHNMGFNDVSKFVKHAS